MSPARKAKKADDEDAVPEAPEVDEAVEADEPELDDEVQGRFDEVKRRAHGLESTLDIHIEAAERKAQQQAAAIIADAERKADEARAAAQRDVDAARAQVDDLVRLRQGLFNSLGVTLSEFGDVLSRSEENPAVVEAEAAAAPAPVDESAIAEQLAARLAPAPVERPLPPLPSAPPVTGVEVRVEPLRDLAAARAIERAFETLPIGAGVSLRSFEGNAAVLEAPGVDVNMLLGSMRSRFPIPFILRDAAPGRLIVQVGGVPGTTGG
ncbi:MAG TPA: hypothetical protein VMH33_07640 [Solirubrobacterales bacterium]|nr:hypothetical protein [Solirubrobacterales bacterium]